MHVRARPEHFFVPPYVGARGWLGVILDRGIDWRSVTTVIREAYEKIAPADLRGRIGKTPSFKPPTQKLRAHDIDPFKSRRALAVLKKLRGICLGLPETTEGSQFGHPVWLAGKKTFAIARYAGVFSDVVLLGRR